MGFLEGGVASALTGGLVHGGDAVGWVAGLAAPGGPWDGSGGQPAFLA
jgi:hypothetical protein